MVHIATAATERERMVVVMDMGWTHFIQQFLPPHPLHVFSSMENLSMYLNHLKLLTQIITVRCCTNAEYTYKLIFCSNTYWLAIIQPSEIINTNNYNEILYL